MFFVAKEKIGTVLGQQKEYAACGRRGIGFTTEPLGNGRSAWHYHWPIEMIEPSVRARFEPQRESRPDSEDAEHGHAMDDGPAHVLWSQEVAPGEVIGEPVISAASGNVDWIAEAKQKFAAARQA